MKEFTINTPDNFELAVTEFEVENAKAVVHIIHGAKEHRKRYYDFCQFLVDKGYSVVIADHRGHGESISEKFRLGHMDGTKRLVSDQVTVCKYIKSKYSNIKYYMYGHSLGTMVARCFIQKYDDKIDKLVLSGTVNYRFGSKITTAVLKQFTNEKNENDYTLKDKLRKLSNTPFFGEDISWLCYNEDNLAGYRKDELCNIEYDNKALQTVVELNGISTNKKKYLCNNKELEILLISGTDDLITGGKKGLVHSINTLIKAGYNNIDYKEYNNMRHEILMEEGKEVVLKDIINFFEIDNRI